jgi:hypothetical protein
MQPWDYSAMTFCIVMFWSATMYLGKWIPAFGINKLPPYTMKTAAAYFSETLISNYKTSQHHNPKNGDKNCFEDLYLMKCSPLWSSGLSSWLQIQSFGFDSRRYQIFWEVVGLERGPLSLVSTTEELLERKCSGSELENQDYGRRDSSLWPCDTLYPQKLALTCWQAEAAQSV